MSKYWGVPHVEYRGKWQWLAQHRGKRLWKIGFTDEEQAGRWLARELGVRTASLRRSGTHLVATSSFRGLVPVQTSPRCPTRWIAQVGRKYLGTFTTEAAGAKALAKHLGTPLAKLPRKNRSRRRASGSRAVQISAQRARCVFKAAYPRFKTYVAGDFENMLQLESKAGSEYMKDFAMFRLRYF